MRDSQSISCESNSFEVTGVLNFCLKCPSPSYMTFKLSWNHFLWKPCLSLRAWSGGFLPLCLLDFVMSPLCVCLPRETGVQVFEGKDLSYSSSLLYLLAKIRLTKLKWTQARRGTPTSSGEQNRKFSA